MISRNCKYYFNFTIFSQKKMRVGWEGKSSQISIVFNLESDSYPVRQFEFNSSLPHCTPYRK